MCTHSGYSVIVRLIQIRDQRQIHESREHRLGSLASQGSYPSSVLSSVTIGKFPYLQNGDLNTTTL